MANKPVPAEEILDDLVTREHNHAARGNTMDFVLRDIAEAKRHLAEAVEQIIGNNSPKQDSWQEANNRLRAEQRKRLAEWLGEEV